jgi:hypothetical protein
MGGRDSSAQRGGRRLRACHGPGCWPGADPALAGAPLTQTGTQPVYVQPSSPTSKTLTWKVPDESTGSLVNQIRT